MKTSGILYAIKFMAYENNIYFQTLTAPEYKIINSSLAIHEIM